MANTADTPVPSLLTTRQTKRLAQQLRFARLAMGWENVWSMAWPIPSVIALFVGLALMDVLPRLAAWTHAFVLFAFAATLIVLLVRLRRLRRPTSAGIERRIESEGGLAHRPLALLADDMATAPDDPVGLALWRAARRASAGRIEHLSMVRPLPQLALHDPWGLRFVPLIVLFVGLAAGWRDAPARLDRALSPQGLLGPAPLMEIWVAPPAYTGLPPVLLSGPGSTLPPPGSVSVPEGSRLTAALQGGRGRARLLVDGESTPFEALGQSSQRLETSLTRGTHLAIRQGWRTLGRWSLQVTPDLPPNVRFTAQPGSDSHKHLQIQVRATDDFGLAKLWLEVRRTEDSASLPPMVIPMPFAGKPKELAQTYPIDLTTHPWSGQSVTLVVVAEDGAGHQGRTEKVPMMLPERVFTHPVARSVNGWRHVMINDYTVRDQAINGLNTILSTPKDFGDDLIAYLALSDAVSRLTYDRSEDSGDNTVDLLWYAALRIEDGKRGGEQDAFNQAAKELSDALSNSDTTPEQMQDLLARFGQSLARLVSSISKGGQRGGTPSSSGPTKTVSGSDLQSMLDQLGDLSHTGSREAAQAMIARLQSMLDNMTSDQSGANPQAGAGEGGKGNEQGGGGIDPFGRPVGGYGGADVKIPTQIDIGAARRVLDELRRRTDDYGRPIPERDYLQRLLEKLY